MDGIVGRRDVLRAMVSVAGAVVAGSGLAALGPFAGRTLAEGPGIRGTYSDWYLPAQGTGYYNYDQTIFPGNLPMPGAGQVTPTYYYASVFEYRNTPGSGGYLGLQVDGNGRRAIFSIWNARAARPSAEPGALARPFDGEGVGYQTMIPYDWQPGHYYRMRVWAVGTDAGGEWWLGVVIDDTTGRETVIGTIQVAPGRGWIAPHIGNFVEWYGQKGDSCAQLPLSDVYFGPPKGDAGSALAGAPSNSFGGGACASALSMYGEWAHHRNGAGA